MSEFVSIYEETMPRVIAADIYFFGEDYFDELARELGAVLQLFVAVVGSKAATAVIVTISDGLVQCHLGGTGNEFLDLSPMTLIFDTVRLWANEIGARAFHLGGGAGAKEDSLFHYKAGFSDRRHEFTTWRWIAAPAIYRELCERQGRTNVLQGLEPTSAEYFPAYRCPAVPLASVQADAADIKHSEPRIYRPA